jgi:hypothetical protein
VEGVGDGERAGLRFVDVLTTASAVANYRGAGDVEAGHLLDAIGILRGELSMEDLGRAVSPLLRRPGQRAGATADVRALVQRWYGQLGGTAEAVLSEEELARFKSELGALAPTRDRASDVM